MLRGARSRGRLGKHWRNPDEPVGVNDVTTAREALLGEMLGDVATLVGRLEAIAPMLDASRESIVRTGEDSAAQISAFETRMASIFAKTQTVAVRHIAQRTNELALKTGAAQTRAMEEAARALFRNELEPAMQRLAASLQRLPQTGPSPFEYWLTLAAVAVLSSALTWVAAAWVWLR
jgi:hypothetical protein